MFRHLLFPRSIQRTFSGKTRLTRTVCAAAAGVLLFLAFRNSPAKGTPGDPATSASAVAPTVRATPAKSVRVITKREGDVTHVFVQNSELCEVTMTFFVHAENLRGTVSYPYTATFAGAQETEAFALEPIDADKPWQFSYTNYYKLGSHCAVHDDDFVYTLPYAPGTARKVTQGYNGRYSHKGSNQYATDWKMPEGTLVYAARGGLVVKVKDDSDRGGSSMKYDKYNNFVLIRHDDGTLGHYCHLKQGGVKVAAGETVRQGQPIALSGNTGFSSGPHLHFCVFKTKDGRERVSIPVKFRNADGEPVTLLSGRTYKAPEVQTTTALHLLPRESVGFGQ